MKVMNVSRIWAKNFICYGNQEVEFLFRDGVTQILGENGSGKSTIFEIMYFVMFNKPFRPKLVKADLINNQNMKNLETGMEFEISEGGITDRYVIERGMKPDYLRISKNGIKQSIASSAINQEVLKSYITSITEGVFTSSVGLSPITAKPIIEMTSEQKRNASNEMFSIRDLDLYKDKIKSKISKIKMEEASLVSSIQSTTISINSLSLAVAEAKLASTEILNQKKETLLVAEATYAEKYNEYVNIQNAINDNTEAYNKAMAERKYPLSSSIENNIRSINNKIDTETNNIRRLNMQKSTIVAGSPCGICNEPLSMSAAEAKTNAIIHELEACTSKIQALTEQKKTEQEKYELAVHEEDSIVQYTVAGNELSIKFESIKATASWMYTSLNNMKAEISQLEHKAANNSSAAEKGLKEAEKKYQEDTERLQTVRRQAAVYKELSTVFSDEGLKAYIISGYIESLNHTINKYLTIIGLPVKIEFDDQFEYKMQSGIGIGNKYHSLSSGQKQRVNLAIALAVIDLTMAISRFKCNVLFLDEIADVAMDDSGMSSFLSIINLISKRDEKSIVLISHKNMKMIENSRDLINYAYEATRVEGNFSTLVELANR